MPTNPSPEVRAVAVCRCDPLPEMSEKPWICGGCGNRRRYYERIAVQNGGIVSTCGDCRYEARPKKVAPTLCRAITFTRLLAGRWRDTETYYLCDKCIDGYIAQGKDAEVLDGRSASLPQQEPGQ